MKKVISVLLAVIFVMVMSVCVFAENYDKDYDFILSCEDSDHVTAEKDDLINVKLKLKCTSDSNDSEMYAFQDEICYDDEILEFMPKSVKAIKGLECVDIKVDELGRRLRVSYILDDSTELFKQETEVLSFDLKILKEVGNTTVYQENQLVSDENGIESYTSETEELIVTTQRYVEELYSVRFAYMNGDTDDEVMINEGMPVSEPEKVMVRDGYTFGGWFTDGQYTQQYDFSQPVNENMILYAKWDRVETSNMLIWYILGGGFLVAGVVVFLVVRKKKD